MWLVILLILVPIVEIGLFIEVGSAIGLWPTLAIVVATALGGAWLLRVQGLSTMQRLRQSVEAGQNPMNPIAHGALILIAAVLLLTPGFFTDATGIALLLPPVRSWLISQGAARFAASTVVYTSGRNTGPTRPGHEPGTTIDGEFSVEDPEPSQPRPSKWTPDD